MQKVAGIAIKASQFFRTQVSAMIQMVNAMAAMVRSHVRPVVDAFTYQASISPESPVPVSCIYETNQYIGCRAPQMARPR